MLLLSVVTRTPRNLGLVLVNLPFALVSGVLAVFASGGLLTSKFGAQRNRKGAQRP